MGVAEGNDDLMTLQKRRKKQKHASKMRRFLKETDLNRNDHIDLQELKFIFENDEMRTWLAAQELDVQDIETLFHLLDTGKDGSLSFTELVQGVGHLKGAARSIDLINFQNQFHVAVKKLEEKIDNSNPNQKSITLE